MADQPSLHEWLMERCERVKELELQARRHIEAGDTEAYRKDMKAKALLLARLHEDGAPLAAALPTGARQPVLERLERFSRSARQALELDSVFYMSALLFPDDYQAGQPNDLERFAETVRA